MAQRREADNGYLYIAPNAVLPVQKPSKNLAALGSGRFAALVQEVGMTGFLDRIEALTIFSPTDAAMNAFESTLATYSKSQKEAFVLNHVVPRVVHSVSISPTVQSLLNQSIALKFAEDRITVGPNARITIADCLMLNGVAHEINAVLVPSPLPGPNETINANANGISWPSKDDVTGSGNTKTGSSNIGERATLQLATLLILVIVSIFT